jgi:hypothetical protein
MQIFQAVAQVALVSDRIQADMLEAAEQREKSATNGFDIAQRSEHHQCSARSAAWSRAAQAGNIDEARVTL